jgi:hypothetical protein
MRRFNLKLFALAALLAVTFSVGAMQAQTAPPDMILFNGKIITVDQRFSVAQGIGSEIKRSIDPQRINGFVKASEIHISN